MDTASGGLECPQSLQTLEVPDLLELSLLPKHTEGYQIPKPPSDCLVILQLNKTSKCLQSRMHLRFSSRTGRARKL